MVREEISGILCECSCYRRKDKIRESSPVNKCLLLVSEEIYNKYLSETDERYKDVFYEFPYVAVLSPGCIRVRLYDNSGDDYTTKINLCNHSLKVRALLREYLGEKIRLGRNLLTKRPNSKK